MHGWQRALLVGAMVLAGSPAHAHPPLDVFLSGARTYAPDNDEARANHERQRA